MIRRAVLMQRDIMAASEQRQRMKVAKKKNIVLCFAFIVEHGTKNNNAFNIFQSHAQDASNSLSRSADSLSRTCRLAQRCVRVLLQRLNLRRSPGCFRLVELIEGNDAAEVLAEVLRNPLAGAVPTAQAHLPRNEFDVNNL